MAEDRDSPPPAAKGVSWIEAALLAGFGRDGGPQAAREALREAAPESEAEPVAWLEAVAVALDSAAGEDAARLATRIRADRDASLGAHGRIEGAAVGDLVRRS